MVVSFKQVSSECLFNNLRDFFVLFVQLWFSRLAYLPTVGNLIFIAVGRISESGSLDKMPTNLIDKFKHFDAYAKTLEDFRVKTATGATSKYFMVCESGWIIYFTQLYTYFIDTTCSKTYQPFSS